MKKVQIIAVLGLLMTIMVGSSAEAVISRTAKRVSVLEFQVGMANPIGEYDRIYGGDLEIIFQNNLGGTIELDADDVYNNSWYFGINYGNLTGGKLYYDIGFQYVKVQHEDTIYISGVPTYAYQDIYGSLKISLYDLNANLNYYFSDPTKISLAPYVGLGFTAGILNTKLADFESENKLVYGVGLNFGADFKVWDSPDDNSFVAVSFSNQLNLTATESRPRYLQLGGSIKYFFRY